MRGTHARIGLEIEAFMLGELGRLSELPVPGVHYSDCDLLVMDFIANDGGGITPRVERHAAELIASLHATPREQFGYDRDTLIGPLLQPNPAGAALGAVLPRPPAALHGAGSMSRGRPPR